MRLALYTIPISAFTVQLLYILQAMKCQTSPDFALLRYGDPLKHLSIDFGGEGGFLYSLSSKLLFWQDDLSCCDARAMSLLAVENNRSELRGSMSLLFAFFLTLCTSQLFETLFCALQGKQPMPETGMTIFEHSLAFAECEAMISSALGFGFFGLTKDGIGASSSNENNGPLLSRGEILQRLNVPPEVLLVCLISCFSHLSSATLAVLGKRHKVRLLNTAVWGCCYMAAFLWSFAKIIANPIESVVDLGVLRFPTVCIVGFIPHLLILVGILVCGTIYGLALLITALSIPQEFATGLSMRQRFAWAYHNLQANVQFSSSSNIRIKMSEDFYTTLLKVGFSVLTAASEAVYLNEGSRIQVAKMTWIEQKRIDDIAATMERRRSPTIPPELLGEHIASGVSFTDHQNSTISASPYARERKSRPTKTEQEKSHPGELDSGLGVAQRRNRMQLTFDFIAGIFWLVIGLQAQLTLSTLRKIGFERRPAWLLKAAGMASGKRKATIKVERSKRHDLDFWVVDADGKMALPKDRNVDVEVEMRNRLQSVDGQASEDNLSENIYGWWRSGGWFGDLDQSGDYSAPSIDDDATSMLSMSTATDMTNDIDDMDGRDNSGRQTPTQRNPFGEWSRESTPASEEGLDMDVLSRLLNPQSAADREEARLLSYSLQSSRPLTRSQYRRTSNRNRAQLLTGLRTPNKSTSTEEEEERDLEQFILSQRAKSKATAAAASTLR